MENNKYSYFGIHLEVLLSLFLVIATIAVYWQITGHDFINFDDDIYVFNNLAVRAGLTYESIKWAFTFTDIAYWHPLTWISHMLDCQLFGLNPGMHHMTNLIFHIFNSLLLFFIFKQMTGALWQSACVAALFALHPINVESVAWIAERKNVLSTFFWMLTMLAYVHYSRLQGIWRYLLTFFMFLLGLMCKPILVTLPFVLLLLDYWPLGRLRLKIDMIDSNSVKAESKKYGFKEFPFFILVLEKVPFFILSAVSIYMSVLSVKQHGIIASTDLTPITLRIANALVSYLVYLGKMLLPLNLAVFYPYPYQIPIFLSAGAGLALLSISFLVIWAFRKKPYMGTGWFWYIGVLLPNTGLIQAGLWPAMADRWTYLPFIGIFIIIVWGVADLKVRWDLKKSHIITAAIAIFLILMVRSYSQGRYWANSITLFEHNLITTSNNYVAHNNLGLALKEKGMINEAAEHYLKAIQINSKFELAYLNLGVIFAGVGDHEKAVGFYKEALRIKPDFIAAHINMGNTHLRQGRIDDAIGNYSEALRFKPDSEEAYNGLGAAMVRIGKLTKAIDYFKKALLLKPNHEGAKRNLKNTLATLERNK
ncbi:MAG: tetratricopeptide repeat protein [Thermodesulfobacteriota bacterium]|nr:tetratricopeptide repeat protein [Thermodesulfobacteriota bacterium]